jgi:hypothetical protein
MIQLRFRQFDWDDWTQVTLDGEDEELGFHILGAWILDTGKLAEVWDEDEWVNLVEEV